jgi:hypothetical protein
VLKETETMSDSVFISLYNQPSLIPSIHPFINPPTILSQFHSFKWLYLSIQCKLGKQAEAKYMQCVTYKTQSFLAAGAQSGWFQHSTVCSQKSLPCKMLREQDLKTQYDSVGASVHHLNCRTRFDTVSFFTPSRKLKIPQQIESHFGHIHLAILNFTNDTVESWLTNSLSQMEN